MDSKRGEFGSQQHSEQRMIRFAVVVCCFKKVGCRESRKQNVVIKVDAVRKSKRIGRKERIS